ncbi:F-box only protein 38 [Octopus sinensis]|uniref:F-box only protein 38 n=1 Tax=Octopus sinensis TaxID=2607531 RepID=A0A6P7S961_9MOLL|nr:F-box only protein 38 [Octopus sinensis]XP_036359025.1 F-box only protein 38 [Octopus sinensis]
MAPCKKLKIDDDITTSPPPSQGLAEDQPMPECPQRRRSARLQLLAKSRSLYEMQLPLPDDYLAELSLEIICRILDYLPLRDVLKMECLSKKIKQAVDLHLRLRRVVDFTEGSIYGWMSDKIHDSTLAHLIGRCTELEYIYGFHPHYIGQRRQRGVNMLSIPGVVHAMSSAPKLKGIEISDIFLLEAILKYLPKLEILGTFKNRDCFFPIFCNNKLSLLSNPLITSLHLTGVVIPELPRMQTLKHLYLRFVRLTQHQPFRDFAAPSLRTFVMAHCAGPINPLRHVPLITSLAMAKSLQRLELLRVPFLGGLIQHIVDDSWRVQGFRNLQAITFGACKHALEVDLGFLIITCEAKLTDLCVQPSLTKDNLFSALTMAEVTFPNFKSLTLGFVDSFPEPGKWTAEELLTEGLVEVQENPAMITDIGMKAVGRCFPSVSHMEIYNCPHLHYPTSWFHPDTNCWSNLKNLHLRRCHAIRLEDLNAFIPMLPSLLSLHLEFMLREPPKGCARVGLSAGTGLGVSSALVQNNGADAHNQPNAAGAGAANNQGDQPPAQAAPVPPAAAAAAAAPAEAEPQHNNAEAEAAAAYPPPPPPMSPPPLPPSPPPLPPSPEQPPPPLPPPPDQLAPLATSAQPLSPPLLPEHSTSQSPLPLSRDSSPHQSPVHCSSHPISTSQCSTPSTSHNCVAPSQQDCATNVAGSSSGSVPRQSGKKNSLLRSKENSSSSQKSCEINDKKSQDGESSSEDGQRIEPGDSSSNRHVPNQLAIGNNHSYLTEQNNLYSAVKAGPSGLNHTCCCTSVIANKRVNHHFGHKNTKVTKCSAEKTSKHTTKSDLHSKGAYTCYNPSVRVISTDTSSAQPSTSGLNICKSDFVNNASIPSVASGSSASKQCTHSSGSSSSSSNSSSSSKGKDGIGGHCSSSSSSSSSNENNSISDDCCSTSRSNVRNCCNNVSDVRSHNSANQWLQEKHKKNLMNMAQRKRMRELDDCCPSSAGGETEGECAKSRSSNKAFSEKLSASSAISGGECSSSTTTSHMHRCNESSSGKKYLHKFLYKKDKHSANAKSSESCSPVSEPQPSTSSSTSSDTVFDVAPPTCDKSADVPPAIGDNMQSSADTDALVSGNHSDSSKCCTFNENNLPSSSCISHSAEAHLEVKCEGNRIPTVSTMSPKGKCLRSGFRTVLKSSAKTTTKSKKGCDSSPLPLLSSSLPSSSSSTSSSSSSPSSSSSSSSSFSGSGPVKMNQSCQAVSEEIRETTKKAKENEDATKSASHSAENASGSERSSSSSAAATNSNNSQNTGSSSRSSSSVRAASSSSSSSSTSNSVQSGWTARSGPKYSYTRKSVKRKMNTCDQATSTSDPVQEEDHIQVLGVQSKTLTTLTLHMVGITNLCLLDCPNLATVSCSACRVLKKISIGKCPKLSRISFAQCKKLLEDQVIKELSPLPSDISRVLFLRPMHQLQIPMTSLFGQEDHSSGYHCLVKDHCKQPSMMVLNRKRAEILVDLLPNINSCLREILKTHENVVVPLEEKCPRSIHNFEEINEDGSVLEVKTDIPWLKFFLQNYSDQKEKDMLPNTPVGRELASERLRQLGENFIKEGIQGDYWSDSVFLVYINMCDISGLPTPDLYV